jgi:peptide chain release factor 1
MSTALSSMQEMMGQPDVASDPDKFQRLAKQTSSLEKTVITYRSYKDCLSAIHDTQELLKEASDDPEMAEMAEEELVELNRNQEVHSASLHQLLTVPSKLSTHGRFIRVHLM